MHQAPRRGARQAGARGDLGQAQARSVAVEGAQHRQAARQRLHVVATVLEALVRLRADFAMACPYRFVRRIDVEGKCFIAVVRNTHNVCA